MAQENWIGRVRLYGGLASDSRGLYVDRKSAMCGGIVSQKDGHIFNSGLLILFKKSPIYIPPSIPS